MQYVSNPNLRNSSGGTFNNAGKIINSVNSSAKKSTPFMEMEISSEEAKELSNQIRLYLLEEERRASVSFFNSGKSRDSGKREISTGRWKLVFAADPVAHNSSPILSVLHAPDEKHQNGSLFSTSNNFLNCWKCGTGSKGKKKGEPHLSLSSAQQNTGYRIFSLCYIPAPRLLVGVGMELASSSPALLAVSVDRSAGNFLAPSDVRAPPAMAMKIESLSDLPSLTSCVATNVNDMITVFDLMCSDFSSQKTSWHAHESYISCLRAAPLSTALVSGSQSGDINLWDMRAPPVRPTSSMCHHSRLVTDVQFLSSYTMWSASADASLLQWDLRNSSLPVEMFVPDGKCVLTLKMNPRKRENIAFSTLKGLYVMDTTTANITNVSSSESLVYSSIEWNASGTILYASTMNGAIECWQAVNSNNQS